MTNTFFAGQKDYIDKLNLLALANDVVNVAKTAAAALISADNSASSASASLSSKNASATSAANSLANANNASTSNTSAQTALAGTTSAASQAANSRDQAIAASQVATAANESLAAMSQTLHSGNIVKMFPYDTAKDSDGGAWTKYQDKFWFKETLGGDKWIGQRATLAAAWATTGAAVSTVYQNTTDGKFYAIGGTSAAPTQTEVFRGISREFPATSMIVAEAGRAIIYDTSVVGCPMWMVFLVSTSFGGLHNTVGLSTITAINGDIYTGSSGSNGSVNKVSFLQDRSFVISLNGLFQNGLVSQRNSTGINIINTNASYRLVANIVNDIAVTVLDNAPVDPATGLKVPTIAVATAGGVSVIRDDGSVVNIGPANTQRYLAIRDKELFISGVENTNLGIWGVRDISETPLVKTANYYSVFSAPIGQQIAPGNEAPIFSAIKNRGFATKAGISGLGLVRDNPRAYTIGLSALITNAYSTGWQVGDSRLATLADTVAETITASGELVTNGTFDVDTAGWGGINATLSVDAGRLKVTTVTNSAGFAEQILPTVVGKSYYVSVGYQPGADRSAISVGTFSGGISLFRQTLSGSGTLNFTFTANSSTSYLLLQPFSNVAGQVSYFDNISTKLAIPDRSVKNNSIVVNGTLIKSPVAEGANLVAYSGFSSANYLEQPYNPILDFGTGDFSVMGWVSLTNSGLAGSIFSRIQKGVVGSLGIDIGVDAGNVFWGRIWQQGQGEIRINSSAVAVSTYNHITFSRVSGVLELWLNGVKQGSIAGASNLTDPLAVLSLGNFNGSANPFKGTMALWRASATAPSADQIAHIYRTELPLFAPGAQCTIEGNSSSITAMTFDDSTELLQVATSWGRSSFKDLVRVESEVSTIGALTSISASNGAVSVASTTSSKTFQPSMSLRSEIKKRIEAARAIGKNLSPFEFDTIGFNATTAASSNSITAVAVTTGTPYIGMGISGTGIPAGTTIVGISGTTYTLSAACTAAGTGVLMGQTTFSVPKGYTVKTVYAGELRKREGSTKAWTRSFDGFVEYISFAVSPGNAVWVSILMARSN